MQKRLHTPFSPTYSFRNIGPIKDADLKLGDLTIIAGKNNTGKTYLVYTLYGLLKTWTSIPIINGHIRSHQNKKLELPDFTSISRKLVQDGKCVLNMTSSEIDQQERKILDVISEEFSCRMLRQVFNTESKYFGNANIKIGTSSGNRRKNIENIVNHTIDNNDGLNIVRDNSQIRFSLDSKNRNTDCRRLEYILSQVYAIAIIKHLLPEPFVLTAERFGISLFYRELDFTKNQILDVLQKMEREKDNDRYSPFIVIDKAMSRFALPIKDNIGYTRSLSDIKGQQSLINDEKVHDNIKHMMNGFYKTHSDGVRFVSKARKKEQRFDVPLHLASASSRGLSDLYFYLRHSAKNNQILILDGPESHLDTGNQVALARLITRMVNVGVRVLLTTHSDYFVKEINNLIMLDSDFEGKSEFMKRKGYTDDERLSVGAVKGYIAQESELVACDIDEFGLDMPVFDSTIHEINAVANELYSKIR